MTITREALQQRLEQLKAEEAQLAAHNQEVVNALNSNLGAQADCLYWLEQLAQEPDKPFLQGPAVAEGVS